MFSILFFASKTFGQGFTTVDFHQAQNDRNGAKTYVIDWVNGILNSTHTDYFEGIGVPQRIVLTGILPNNANTPFVNRHSLRFQVLAEKGGKHAYDFPISWDQAFKTAEDIGNGTVNELQNLYTQKCDPAFSATGAAACAALNIVTGSNVQTAAFPDNIGNPGNPALGAPNVNTNIACFENYVKAGISGPRYGNRLIEIRGNQPVSNVSVTFNGYKGSGNDLAEYTLLWESTSDMVMIRFATHLASGNGSCGYGSGQGAGSINGGPYHVTLERLDDRDGKSGVSLGSQDNQIMSNAVQIPPPTCNLSPGSSGCTNTATSFTVNYSSTDAANATVKFYFLTNTAGAKLPNAVTAAGSCSSNNYSVTADASGNASISITPSGTAFTAGSFRVGACVTTGSGTATCEQSSATTIDEATVVAKVNGNTTTLASPFNIDANLANPTAALTSLASLNGVQNNALFSSFTWTVTSQANAPGNIAVLGNLSNAAVSGPTFTPTLKNAGAGPGYEAGLYAFDVTVTSTANSCQATARVFINVSAGAACPSDITGPSPVCAGATSLVYSSAILAAKSPFPEPGLTYTWSINPSGAATITSTSVNVTSITVTAGTTNFGVRVTVTNENNEVFFNSGCEYSVTVNPIPSCSITGPDPVCGGSTGNTYTSTVLPSGGTVTHSWSITGDGTITSALNGASITVTAGASGSYTVRDDITRNGCTSYCTKTVTVNPVPSCSITGPDPVCAGSTGNTYTSTVLPSGGTVTHSWSITGDGTITSALDGASITVTAGASGSYTVRDDITRNGCTSYCTKTVTVNVCGKACTPGFWKTHPEVWDAQNDFTVDNMPGVLTNPVTTGGTFITTTSFYTYFNIPPTIDISTNGGLTMLGATELGGGDCKALARHGVSALLGAAAFPTEYPFPSGSTDFASLYTLIRNAFLSGNCSALATTLANINNLDGPFCSALSNLPPVSLSRVFSSTGVVEEQNLTLSAYPNPYTNVVNFRFVSPTSGKAALEVYNLLGQKLAIVYQGNVNADIPVNVTYNVPATSRSTLIYTLTVDGKTLRGSILPHIE